METSPNAYDSHYQRICDFFLLLFRHWTQERDIYFRMYLVILFHRQHRIKFPMSPSNFIAHRILFSVPFAFCLSQKNH